MQSEVSCGGGDRVARVSSDHLQDSQRNKIEHKIQQHFAETPFSSRTPLLSKGDFSSSQHFLFPTDSSHPKCSAIILRSKLLRRRGPPLFRRATSQPFQFPCLAAFSPYLAAPAFRLSLFLLPSFLQQVRFLWRFAFGVACSSIPGEVRGPLSFYIG